MRIIKKQPIILTTNLANIINLRKINKIIIVIFLMISCNEITSQTILNGSFENNNEINCAYNMISTNFNASMQNVNSFGTICQLDIQKNGCSITPQFGNWCLGLATFPLGGHDAVTLKFTEPLTIGLFYEIRFWTYNNTIYSSQLGQPKDSIQIGLSMKNNTYGKKIHTSFPQFNIWQEHIIQIVADLNYSFLSVKMNEDFSSPTWIQVDNFSISNSLGVHNVESSNELDVILYPSPASNQLFIRSNRRFKNEFKIIGITSQLVKILYSSENTINISDLPNGIYIIEFMIDEYLVRKKFIKQ